MTNASPLAPPKSSWEANADFWVKIIREHRDRYRTELTDAAVLEAIGDCAGLDVLDVGCGEGYMSRELAGRGARVKGIDKAAPLIAAAAAAAVPGATFAEGDAASLQFSGGSFDLVVANHMMNDLPAVAGPVGEFARVLRPGGRLVILMLHPCFYGYRAETTALASVPAADEYFTQRPVEQTFEVDGLESPAESTSWVRPLEAYTGAIAASGLHIATLSEPHPSAEQAAASTWWRDNFPRPLFMLTTAVKPPPPAETLTDAELVTEVQRRLTRRRSHA